MTARSQDESTSAMDTWVREDGAAFLRATVREDGSWPIDTNLATWVTTQSVNALSRAGLREHLAPPERERLRHGQESI